MPSGSCAGSVRHQHAMVARLLGDEALARRAAAVAARTWELSELLTDVLGVEDVGAYYPHRVTYHPTCHSLRVLGVGDRPLRLLRQVTGLALVELPEAVVCCGFGGTFAVKNADTSTAMLADKMRHVLSTGAGVGAHRRGQLVPDAHRRRAVPAAGRGQDLCTWPRSSPRPGPGLQVRDDVPGDAAGGAARGRAPAGRRGVPGRRPPGAGRQPAAGQPGQGHLDDPGQAGPGGGRSRRDGRSCGPRARPSRRPRWPGWTSTWSGWRPR